jgi:site-specific recombinase XerD
MAIRDVAIIALLADTGLRRAEVVKLRVEQIQWLASDGRGCLQDVHGKADRLRLLPFSATIGQILRHYLEYRLSLVQQQTEIKELFIQQNGRPLQPGSIYQILRRIAIKAGVEDETWNTHSMRHSFATHFWRVQRDTKSLSVILGHSSQKITEDIYVHPVAQDLIACHTSPVATGMVQTPVNIEPQTVIQREELLESIRSTPNWRSLGRQYGLSDSGIRKLAKRYDLLEDYYQARSVQSN